MGRAVLLWMIPLNLFLVAWVWIGRVLFGVGGWFLLIFLVSIVPILLVALTVTTILAFTQHGHPRSLTRLQAWAQVATWAGLLAFGAFCPDFGDTAESEIALLTQVFGRSEAMLSASYTLTVAAGVLAVTAYLVLLGSLVFGRREAPATMRV